MFDFKQPEIEDKKWVDDCFKYVKSYNCEYTFGNLFVWSTSYFTKICEYNGFMLCRWGRDNDIKYSVPIGNGDFRDAVEKLIDDAESNGIELQIYGVTENYKKLFDEYFPGRFSYSYDEGFNDYIYSVEKMAELKGKNITESATI